MTVISFVDYAPIPRFDGVAWHHASIQEGPTADGPWTEIESVVLTPVDTDPKQPIARNFTTENATLIEGWYRIVFFDIDGDTQAPTEAIHNVPDTEDPYLPTISTVGALLRARTVDKSGTEVGTFTKDTKPTQEEAMILIRQAGRDVSLKLGPEIPEAYLEDARHLVALKAAMLIELSYYPEQVAANNSPYDRYKVLYDEGLPSLVMAVTDAEGAEGDTEAASGLAHFAFPVDKGGLVGWETNW
jgi:hypothetical protein